MRRVVAVIIFVGGFWLATYPFTSVWSSTSTALGSLPEVQSEGSVDDRNWDAILSPDFVVATRVEKGIAPEKYRDAMVAAGFESASLTGELWWMKECCGDYGYAQAKLEESGSGGTLVTVSLYDNDVQATWFFISGLGILIVLVALGVGWGRSTNRSEELAPAA